SLLLLTLINKSPISFAEYSASPNSNSIKLSFLSVSDLPNQCSFLFSISFIYCKTIMFADAISFVEQVLKLNMYLNSQSNNNTVIEFLIEEVFSIYKAIKCKISCHPEPTGNKISLEDSLFKLYSLQVVLIIKIHLFKNEQLFSRSSCL